MNIVKVILGVLGIGSIAQSDAFKPLPRETALEATRILNQFRRSVHSSDMQAVQYDFAAQARLDAIIEANSPHWMFEPYTGSEAPIRQNINGYYISEALGYPKGYQIGWHDTCAKLGDNCVIVNLRFRTNQLKCFNYSNCSDTVYDRYRSCKTAANEVGSGSPCSFAWVYVPQFLTANITKMACAVLNVPGWKPPKSQLNSYWCYTNGIAPLNDQPYTEGKACSDCEPEQHCKQKLCV